jgi:hypothetical protein
MKINESINLNVFKVTNQNSVACFKVDNCNLLKLWCFERRLKFLIQTPYCLNAGMTRI